MPVIEKPFFALESSYCLSEFLTECYRAFLNNKHPRFVSIQFPISRFNPLAVLQCLQQDDQHHFYFEHEGDCFVGLGKAIQLRVESRDRFTQTRDLIADLSAQIQAVRTTAQVDAPVSEGSRFFCSFSFLGQAKRIRVRRPSYCPVGRSSSGHLRVNQRLGRSLILRYIQSLFRPLRVSAFGRSWPK